MVAKKKGPDPKEGPLVIAVNKKARRDYEILDVFEAGIVLLGHEVKSIRAGSINLRDSYIRVANGELILVGCHISPYENARVEECKPKRDRKLLLHRKEIDRLGGQVQRRGLTLVPLRVYFNKRGRCKLELGLGRGKKLYDKRQDERTKEAKREIERGLRTK